MVSIHTLRICIVLFAYSHTRSLAVQSVTQLITRPMQLWIIFVFALTGWIATNVILLRHATNQRRLKLKQFFNVFLNVFKLLIVAIRILAMIRCYSTKKPVFLLYCRLLLCCFIKIYTG